MGSPSDFYEVLNIPKNSTAEEIRKAYKTLVKKWHPDKHPPSSKLEAEAKFKAITQAYEALRSHQKSGGSPMPEKKREDSVPKCASHQKSGGSPMPEKKREDSVPKYASIPEPIRVFKDLYCLSSFNKKDFGHLRGVAATPNHARTPGREFMDLHYSRGAAAPTVVSSPALRPKSLSGQLRRKPPAVERMLECTLEELCKGCQKQVTFVKDVVGKSGVIVQKKETRSIKVEPGWKKGTKIIFRGIGDERPGCLPADLVFVISEKEHINYRRVGNDLILKVRIPLVGALTGWMLPVKLLTGEKMTCPINEIVYPGYEKVIQGQGMPRANGKGQNGDLRIKFEIIFPTPLSSEQKSGLVEILKGAT